MRESEYLVSNDIPSRKLSAVWRAIFLLYTSAIAKTKKAAHGHRPWHTAIKERPLRFSLKEYVSTVYKKYFKSGVILPITSVSE
jgi:hypothetical protein